MAGTLPPEIVSRAIAIMDAAHKKELLWGHLEPAPGRHHTMRMPRTSMTMLQVCIVQLRCIQGPAVLCSLDPRTSHLPIQLQCIQGRLVLCSLDPFMSHPREETPLCSNLPMMTTPYRSRQPPYTPGSVWHKVSCRKHGKTLHPTPTSWMEMFAAANTCWMYWPDVPTLRTWKQFDLLAVPSDCPPCSDPA